jgi:hypothetical protein
MQFVHYCRDINLVTNRKRLLANLGRSKHFGDFFLARFESMLGASIHFGKHHNHRDSKAAAQVQMMLSHVSWRLSTIYQNESVIGKPRRNAVDTDKARVKKHERERVRVRQNKTMEA